MNSKNLRSHGFTLIELLVVIGIIGILATLAVSAFETYKSRAWNAKLTVLARNVYQAQENYKSEHEVYLDCTVDNGVSTCASLAGIAGLDLSGYSMINMNLTDGVLIGTCHLQAEFGIAYVTDSGHPFFTHNEFHPINLAGVGSCSLAAFGV